MFNKKIIAIFGLFFFSSTPTFAQESFDLYQCIQSALDKNHELKSSYYNSVAESKEVDKSFAYFLPQLRYSRSKGQSSSDITNSQGSSSRDYNTQNESLNLKQSIFNAVNINNYRESKDSSLKALYDYESKKLDISVSVLKMYASILNDRQLIAYTEKQIEALKGQSIQMEKNYIAGRGSLLEVNQFKAHLAITESKLLEYRNALDNDSKNLESAIGVSKVSIKESSQTEVLNATGIVSLKDFEFYSDAALKSSPSILAAMHDSFAANANISAQKSAHLPTLDLVLSKTKSESEYINQIGTKYDTESIAFQFNVPLYLGGYTNASVKQSEAKAMEKEEKLKAIRENVLNIIRKNYSDTKTGLAKVDALSESVKSFEFSYNAVKMGYEKGIKSYIDLLVTQDKFYDSVKELNKEKILLIQNYLSLKIAINDLTQLDEKIIGDL